MDLTGQISSIPCDLWGVLFFNAPEHVLQNIQAYTTDELCMVGASVGGRSALGGFWRHYSWSLNHHFSWWNHVKHGKTTHFWWLNPNKSSDIMTFALGLGLFQLFQVGRAYGHFQMAHTPLFECISETLPHHTLALEALAWHWHGMTSTHLGENQWKTSKLI